MRGVPDEKRQIDDETSYYTDYDYYTVIDATSFLDVTSYFSSDVPPTYRSEAGHSHTGYFWVGPNRKGPR